MSALAKSLDPSDANTVVRIGDAGENTSHIGREQVLANALVKSVSGEVSRVGEKLCVPGMTERMVSKNSVYFAVSC